MSRDWHAWYGEYDDPASNLSRRLAVVRTRLADLLAEASGPVRVLSLCAGDGRDTLPVLAATDRPMRAVLIELDPALAQRAREAAAGLRLDVEVLTADAGTTAAYEGAVPADVLLACGVFGNITDADVARTVAELPRLLAPGGTVIWTRGRRVPQDPTATEGDPSEVVRELFLRAGFTELSFDRPEDAGFRVGVHRLTTDPDTFRPDRRLFTFL